MGVNTYVDIKGRNGDLLRAVAGSKGALASLREEQRRFRVEGQLNERQLRNINRELAQQSKHLGILTGNFLSIRNVLRNLAVQGAIAGFGDLTSAISAAATGATTLAASLTNLGAAAGLGFGANLAASIQGLLVWKLALKGVGAAIMSAGRAHELALSKLTQVQRKFVGDARGLREGYRQLQLVAQNGLLPGLGRAVKEASKLGPIIRTAVFDTAQVLGYLAERGVGMINKRLPEMRLLLERNALTLQHLGKTVENFGSGFLTIFPALNPLIGHMTAGVEKFSASFKDAVGTKSGFATVQKITKNLRTSWDNWTSIIGHAGKALFHVWDAVQPVVHKVERAMLGVAKNADRWTGSHKDDIKRYFDAGLKPLGAFARLVGDVAKDLGKLAFDNNEKTARFFDSVRTEFLPVLMDVITTITNDLGPSIGHLLLDVIHLFDSMLPGIKTLTKAFKPFADILSFMLESAKGIIDYANQFGSVAGAIATLGVGAAVIVGWKALRTEVGLTIQALRYYTGTGGLNAEKPSRAAFVSALPGDRAVAGIAKRVRTRSNVSDEPAFQQFLAGQYTTTGRGQQGRMSRLRTATSQVFARFGTATNRMMPFRNAGDIAGTGRNSATQPVGIFPRDLYGQYGRGSGVFRVQPINATQGLPTQRVDSRGRVYYQDPVTGRRIAKPPLYIDQHGMAVGQATRGARPTRLAPANAAAVRNIAMPYGYPGYDSFSGRTRQTGGGRFTLTPTGAHATIPAPNIPGARSGRGIDTVAGGVEGGIVAGGTRGFTKLARIGGGILGGVMLSGAIEGALSSQKGGIGNKILDALSGATLGIVDGPTAKAQKYDATFKDFLGGASQAPLSQFTTNTMKTLRGQKITVPSGGGLHNDTFKARDIQLGNGPRLDLTKLDKDKQEVLNKFADIVDAGKELGKRKIFIPIDGTVTADAANRVTFALDEMKKMGGASMHDLRGRVNTNMKIIRETLGSESSAGKSAISRNFTLAIGAIKKSMADGVVSSGAGWANIRKIFRQNLMAYGFSETQAKNYANSKTGDTAGKGSGTTTAQGVKIAPGAARGAMFRLPGQAGPDSIPLDINGRKILAAPGEDVAIFNRHQRRYIDERLAEDGGLTGVFKKVNRKHFAGGGWVTGDTDYKPAVGTALTKMAKAKGTPIFVQSGGRTAAEQQGLIAKYGANNPAHPVAGLNGPHVRGIAADITPGRPVFGDVAGRYGMGFTVPVEPWHVQMLNGAAGAAAAMKLIPRQMAKGLNGGILGGGIQGMLDLSVNAMNSLLSSLGSPGAAGDGTGPSSAGGQFNKSQLAALWRRAGGAGDVANLMAAIALAESGGNPSITNRQGSGATGLWQILGLPFPGDATDPLTNARMAVAKYETQGLGAWEAYTNGNYKTYMARGGWIRAAMGALFHGATPPTLGNDPGAPDTTQAIPTPAPKSGSKTKKKKKKKGKVRDLAGGKPTLGAGIQRSQFKPTKKKPIRVRKSVKALLKDTFKQDAFSASDIFDPITGERLDLKDIYPAIANLDLGTDFITTLQDQLSTAQSYHDMTSEEFSVSLDDADPWHDLTNYLVAHGEKDPEAWKTKYGSSLDLVNDVPGGYSVHGNNVRGIQEYVAEIQEQLGYHLTRQASPVQALFGGGIAGVMGYQKRQAEAIPAEQAIAERRSKLAKVKAAVEAAIELRKAYFRKMSKMGTKGYTWKEAVDHNQSIIEKWQRWKRDSVGETLGETRGANSEIDRLKGENKQLKHAKPKGQVYGSKDYAAVRDQWLRSKREISVLQGGDGTDALWNPQEGIDNGLAGRILVTLNEWKEIKTGKDSMLDSLKTAMPQEQLAIDTLKKQMRDAGLTSVLGPQASNGSATDNNAQQLQDLQKIAAQNKISDALTDSVHWDVLKNFTSLLQGRMVGSFAQGGIVPETGMALVHKGEFINPAPDGPYRNGSNAAAQWNGATPQITLILKDRAGDLVELIDARVDGRAADVVSRRQGRRQSILTSAPGR